MKYLEILKTVMGVMPDGNRPSFKDWKKHLREYPLTKEVVDLLDGIPQGTFYHPEFDVLKHVYYVCRASMCGTDTTLLEAAFLHDVGKSTHTNIGKNRIYSFGHADASARFVEKNKNNITDFELTHRIVKQHMNKPKQYDIPLSFFVWADKTESRKLYLSESNTVERSINKCKEKILYVKQRFSKKRVILLVGISGSGKSTYIKKHFDEKYVVSPDEVRRSMGDINEQRNSEIWPLTKSIMHGKLKLHGMVVLDATNVNKWLRIQFLADFNGCHKEVIFFPIELDVAIERVNADIANGIDRSNVPENVIRKQFKLLDKGTRSIYQEFNTVTICQDNMST